MPTSQSHVKVIQGTDRKISHDWYVYHSNVHLLLRYLAAEGRPASVLVAAHLHPWKYREEYEEAARWEAADARE